MYICPALCPSHPMFPQSQKPTVSVMHSADHKSRNAALQEENAVGEFDDFAEQLVVRFGVSSEKYEDNR
jgi:hypothetical protein